MTLIAYDSLAGWQTTAWSGSLLRKKHGCVRCCLLCPFMLPNGVCVCASTHTQATTLKTWSGKPENVAAAQAILVALAKANSEAQRGVYKGPHPVPGGGRILQALRVGGAGK